MNQDTQRTFRFLQQLAADLSDGTIAFTTFADATIKVRMALNDPRLTIEKLAATIAAEPLLPVRLLRVANSVALNPSGTPISDIKGAIRRVGHSTIRSIAINVALSQLAHMKDLAPFAEEAKAVVRHSADVAALAYVIARRMTVINRDEALFAGVVHDIGRFYLFSRVAKYPELQGDSTASAGLVDAWHSAVGHAILLSMGAPEAVAEAVNHHHDDIGCAAPRNLGDVLNIANRVSHSPNPLNQGPHSAAERDELVAPAVYDVLDESAAELRALATALRS